MTLTETYATDRGELAYIALRAIEEHLAKCNLGITEGFEDGVHSAIWDALAYAEVIKK